MNCGVLFGSVGCVVGCFVFTLAWFVWDLMLTVVTDLVCFEFLLVALR